MDYQELRNLLETHPNWPAEPDESLVTWCNDPTIVRDRERVTTEEVFTECLREQAEWDAMTAENRQIVRDICAVYDGVPTKSGDPARDTLVAVLGTNTKAAVAAIIPETVSPAVDADLGVVIIGDVQNARAL